MTVVLADAAGIVYLNILKKDHFVIWVELEHAVRIEFLIIEQL